MGREAQEQGKSQGKRRTMRSPRNGAECRLLQKGETANREGGSLTVRARAALAKVLDDPVLERAFKRLATIAAGEGEKASKDCDAVQALRLMSDVTGLRLPDGETRPLDIRITFRNRESGDAAPLELASGEAGNEGGVEL